MTPVLISATERAARDTMGLTSIIAAYVIEVLSESRAGAAFVTGESSLLQQPEFRDPDKAHRVISYLSDSDHLMRLPGAADNNPVRVIIGPENLAEELRDSSVVMASYDAGEGQRGLIGVVGPLRTGLQRRGCQAQIHCRLDSAVCSAQAKPPRASEK